MPIKENGAGFGGHDSDKGRPEREIADRAMSQPYSPRVESMRMSASKHDNDADVEQFHMHTTGDVCTPFSALSDEERRHWRREYLVAEYRRAKWPQLPGWRALSGPERDVWRCEYEKVLREIHSVTVNEVERDKLGASDIVSKAVDSISAKAASRDPHGNKGGERSMARCVAAFNAYTGRDLTELEGWQFMMSLKLARMTTAGGELNLDDYIDAAGYAGLAGECAQK